MYVSPIEIILILLGISIWSVICYCEGQLKERKANSIEQNWWERPNGKG